MTTNPAQVREWLCSNHPKSLALLDKFEIELRLGRLSRRDHKGSTDRRLITVRTVELLRQMIGSIRWKTPAELMALLRGLGEELHAAGGFREPAIGNVVRRIMAAVREEVMTNTGGASASGTSTGGQPQPLQPSLRDGRRSLESMLWALPQHVKSHRKTRSESRGDALEMLTDLPPPFYQPRPDLKQAVMEAIQEIMSDLEDLHKNISDHAPHHIHAGEIILTYGRSQTVEKFLKAASEKDLKFTVLVCEGAPQYQGHETAKSLAAAGIDTCVIHDNAVFAIMARVHKVVLPAHAVLANGGLIAPSGCNLVATAAKHYAVPVVCLTGMFKLTPLYPHDEQDTLNDMLSPSSVVNYAERNSHPALQQVEFLNPVHDYLRPELINLYVTNVGSFQPNYIYRLLAEYYHNDDWESFE